MHKQIRLVSDALNAQNWEKLEATLQRCEAKIEERTDSILLKVNESFETLNKSVSQPQQSRERTIPDEHLLSVPTTSPTSHRLRSPSPRPERSTSPTLRRLRSRSPRPESRGHSSDVPWHH